MDLDTPLTDLFPPLDKRQWRELVARSLPGTDPERLARRLAHGLAVQPLYTDEDWQPSDPAEWPGAAPFTRGGRGPDDGGWAVVQRLTLVADDDVAALVAAELDGGADGVDLDLAHHADPAAALAAALDVLARAEGTLTVHADPAAGETAQRLAAWREAHPGRPVLLRLDPLARWQATGALPDALETTMAAAAGTARAAAGGTVLECSAVPTHEAGGDAVQELAVLLASGVTWLRVLGEAGLALEDAVPLLRLRVAVGTRQFGEIAKLRAARRLWARLIESCGGAPQQRRVVLAAETSRRVLTRRDPWVNILRGTVGCFAAAVGGADTITVHPFDLLLRRGDAAARRLARNTQLVLREEGRLGHVLDPAGGSWHVESRTDDLCAAAWDLFREIERRGGLPAVLRDGWWQQEVAAVAEQAARRVATRRDPITGVSEFPLLDQDLPAGPPPLPPRPPVVGDADPIAPLPLRRPAAPYEELRDAADAAAARPGGRPTVPLVTMGPLAAHTARESFARNLLASGGIAARVVGDAGVAGREPLAELDGAPLAILCGSDEAYAEAAADLARALKRRGVGCVVLAGRPGDREQAWREAGIDRYVHAGCDALDFLAHVHELLEVTP